MENKQRRTFIPGLIIIALGAFMLYLSLSVPDNPSQVDNRVLNFLSEARFLPLILSVVMLVLGLVFTLQLIKGKATCDSGMTKGMMGREGILTAMTVVYLILVTKFNFLIPTVIYLLAMLFYMNWGKKKWWYLILLAAIYTVIVLVLTPYVLQLKVPLI